MPSWFLSFPNRISRMACNRTRISNYRTNGFYFFWRALQVAPDRMSTGDLLRFMFLINFKNLSFQKFDHFLIGQRSKNYDITDVLRLECSIRSEEHTSE